MNIAQSVGRAASHFIPQPPSNDLTTLAKKFFLDYSIFTAIDPKWLATNQKSLSRLSFSGKLQHSAKVATVCFIRGLIVTPIICKINYLIATWVSRRSPEENNRYEEFMMKNPIVPILYAPISEELVFRGGAFNCFHYLQQKAMKSTTPIQQRTSIHNFLSSPGFPHLFSALLFGQLHLIGNKKLLPSFALNSQYLLHYHFTSAEFSILYASTGTIFAPITAHIIHNALHILGAKIFSK